MSSVYAISSIFLKKTIPFHALFSTTNIAPSTLLLQTFNSTSLNKINPSHASQKFVYPSAKMNGPDELPAKSPPEVPTAPPFHKPGMPPEMPRRPKVRDFDVITPERPAGPPPMPPGPSPEFPGPPNPSPPDQPEIVPPYGPDVFPLPKPEIDPPHGPDFIPPRPPEPGCPNSNQPDMPPPVTM